MNDTKLITDNDAQAVATLTVCLYLANSDIWQLDDETLYEHLRAIQQTVRALQQCSLRVQLQYASLVTDAFSLLCNALVESGFDDARSGLIGMSVTDEVQLNAIFWHCENLLTLAGQAGLQAKG